MKQKRKSLSRLLCMFLSIMMLLSVLPLAVSAACSHSYTKVYSYENANMHSYKSKCTKCGEIKEGWGYSGWLDHNFSGNKCTDCGYSKACSHSSTSTQYSNLSSTQHKYWTHCNSCGIDYYFNTVSHSWSYGSWSATSSSSHQRSKSCVCGASSSETGSHSYSGNSCTKCGYTKTTTTPTTPSNPVVSASVSLSASSSTGTLGSAGGEIAAESCPASYTVYASASGCSVTRIVYTKNGKSYTSYSSSVTITASSETDFYTTTFTAYTDAGVTATMTVNHKFVKKSNAYIMWETSHEATIRSITGNGLNKSLSYTMTIPNSYDEQTNLSSSQVAEIQGLIGRNDGKTYIVNYTRTIWVYTPAQYSSTGEKYYHGSFNGNNSSEIEDCVSRWGWGADTKEAIRQAARGSLSFTTSVATDCTAIWIDTSTNKQLYSKSFGGSITGSTSTIVSVSYSEYSGSGNYIYESLKYSGDTSGTSTSQSYSQTYTASSKPLTVTFYCHPETAEATTGSITVTVRDADTNAVISGAYVSGAGKGGNTGSNGKLLFNDIAFGTYTFTASKSGYTSNTGRATISASSPTASITIYLSKPTVEEEEPDDTTGSVTVYVRDANTYALLSSAYVSGNGYGGYTNSYGYVSFSDLSFGSYTFSASKSGYYSNSSSVYISRSNAYPSVTIYLTPITAVEEDPTTDMEVRVVDGSTGYAISGATVSGAGSTKITNSSGYAYYYDLDIGTYYMSASKSGYESNGANATLTEGVTKYLTIYLYPEVVTPTTGSITVYVKDANTGESISSASVSGGGYSGTTNTSGYKTFSSIPLGNYTFTASKTGYYTNTGTATISTSNTSTSVTIYLTPQPTSGTITVYVKDANTGANISSASVSGGSYSGTTNSSGYKTFTSVAFGSYTFSASKSGYFSNTGTASISMSSTSATVTIYLTPHPTVGTINVTVRDKDTNAVISGASVSGGGYSRTTNTSGVASFADIPLGSYTFTASKSGYDPASGSATISVSATSKSITIYLCKTKADVGIEANSINGTVYRGSTIMVSADVSTDSNYDFTPTLPLTVTMKATRNGGTVFDTQTKTVICPKGESNLVWFAVEIPKTGYSSADVIFNFTVTTPTTITDSSSTNNLSTKTATTYVLPDRSTPDASFELEPPSSFVNTPYKTRNANTLSWSVWEWNGGFVKKTYSAKLTTTATLTPDSTAVWKQQTASGWKTRSGYGLNTAVTVSLTGVPADMFAGNAKVNAYYPEFNYSTSGTKSNMLLRASENAGGYSASYTFDTDADSISGGKMHKTPIWFPDGDYSVKYEFYDLWTPAGMLTANNYAVIGIEGSMYDDYYTNRG